MPWCGSSPSANRTVCVSPTSAAARRADASLSLLLGNAFVALLRAPLQFVASESVSYERGGREQIMT